MPSVYPRAAAAGQVPEPLDPATCAERIVAAREENPRATRASVAGICLAGSDDVRGYYRVWDEVEAERIAMLGVQVADYATLTKFKSTLAACGRHLDATAWVNGLKDQASVTTWTALKALAMEAAEV